MSNYRWLGKLHEEHYATLLRTARAQLSHRINSDAEAEDVVQEAFLLAVEKDIRDHEAPLKWLMKTTVNLCKRRSEHAYREEQKRQRVIRNKMDHSADRSVYAVERQESSADMQETLLTLEQTLTADDWSLIKELYLQGKTKETVAQEKGISVNALTVRIYRIRKKLNKIFCDV